MNRRLPLGSPPAGVGSRTTSPAAVSWAVWAALLTGAASAPQAAVSGFSTPCTIPDAATAVLGVLLAVAVLATVGRTGVPGDDAQSPCVITGDYPMIRDAAAPAPAQRARGS